MFKTGTAGQVSKHSKYICFINMFLGVCFSDREGFIDPRADPFQNHAQKPAHAEGSSHRDKTQSADLTGWFWNNSATKLLHTV